MQTFTDPATGRAYIVDPVTGQSRWLDEITPPAQARSTPGQVPLVPASKRRKTSLWVAIGLPIVLVVGGVAAWAWPTAGGCEEQVNAEVVKALQAPSLTNYRFDTHQSHYWRCYGQSDESMKEIGQRVLARHWAELLDKGLRDAVGSGS